ncbi:MAG TPA: LPS assembly protein LptD [Planctomycetota bacterium]|nr:LPS assembly protein LptD [Planctomycetota bacterium]
MGRHGIGLGAALVLALAASAEAQEQKHPEKHPEKAQGPQKSVIDAAHILRWEEDDGSVMFLTGGFTVTRPDVKIQGGRAMVWTSKDSDRSFDEIYAEGNVIVTRGVQKLNCERFFYSDVTEKGAIVDVRLKAYSKDLKVDFFATAKEARINGKNKEKLVAHDVSLTSCSYGVPHYHLTVDHATMLGSDESVERKRGKVGFSGFGEDWSVDFDPLVPEFSGIPVFYIPGLSIGPWLMNFPLRTIRFGHSSRFGNFVYTDFGSRIRLKDENGRLKQWGDIDLKVDWRQVRGWAGGVDFQYKWEGYKGYLDSYYLKDDGRRPGSDFDNQFPPLQHDDRGKAHWFHRQDLDEHWRYELEVYYLSDRSLLEEFFPHEFKEMKDPETAAYVRWMNANMGAFLLGRYRINDFQTQDNYLPRVDFNLLSEPILPGVSDNLYLTERVDTVNIRRRFDSDLGLAGVDTWRVDAETRLHAPFDFRWFQIAPFIQNRLTFYENDLADDSRVRDVWTGGARITTQIHATHADLNWERMGLRGLRHVIEVEGRYANNFSNNVNPSELFQYEPVDGIDHFQEVAFEIRQRFLTKDASNHPYQFFALTLGIEYYPDSARDTTSANPNNSIEPFNWIPLSADPTTGLYPRRLWSNLHYGFEFRPRNFFAVTGSGEYNPVTHAEEVRELGVTFTPFEGFTGSVAQTLTQGVTNAVSLGVTWAMTPKWSVSVLGQYDFKANEYLTQNLVVARDFHDFSIEAVFERDFTRDDKRFLVAVVPKFLGKAGLRRSHLYRPGELVEAPTDR